MEETFHPLWGVRTTDCATYTPMGEVLPTGRAGEQDAALGTGCIVYDEQEKLYYIYYTGERYKPASDEDRQVVMRATSPDFKTWTKDPLFRLRGGDYGLPVRISRPGPRTRSSVCAAVTTAIARSISATRLFGKWRTAGT